jgi:exosortase/archaeosortase family protein
MQGASLIPSPSIAVVGIIVFFTSFILINKIKELHFKFFFLLLSYSSLFGVFFGYAALIPTLLTGIYGFSAAFPFFVSLFLEEHYTSLAIWFTSLGLKIVGITHTIDDHTIEFFSASNSKIHLLIDSRCSGTASLGVFIALFSLMMLDIWIPIRKAVKLFIFGIAGTFFQNILRLIILILLAYNYGYQAMWSAHTYAGYILFSLWFAIFAFIYLRQAKI